jgi:tetratricopeptide (TPR) repeat protein
MNENLPDDGPRRPSRWEVAMIYLSWLRHRPWFWLLPTAPPLILSCTMMTVSVVESAKTIDHQDRYLKALDVAYTHEDFVSASIYFTKLREIGYKHYPNARFIGAVLDARAGRIEDAREVLGQIAPANRAGFSPAHLWQAKEMLAEELSPAKLNEVRHHLQSALADPDDEVWIRTSLAKVCIQQKDYLTALDQLSRVVSQQPELNVLISEVYEKQGNSSGRMTALRQASEFFQRRLTEDPENTDTRTILAMIYYKMGDLEAGLQIVEQGLNSRDSDLSLRVTMSKLLIAQFDEVTRHRAADSGGVVTQLSLLQKAIEMDPNNPLVLMRLKVLMDDPDKEARNGAKGILNQMLAAGQSTGTVHFILGTQAIAEDDKDAAKFHFQQSYQNLRSLDNNPEVPSLLNNLAWMLVQQDDNLDQALELVNQGIGLLEANDSRHPFIRETRGQIYMRLEKWPEAVTDLEFAMKSLNREGQLSAHKALSVAYQHLGRPEVSAEHDKLADQLTDEE